MTTAKGAEVSMAFEVAGDRLYPGLARLRFKLNQAVRRNQISAWRFDRPISHAVGRSRWRANVVFLNLEEAILGKLAASGP